MLFFPLIDVKMPTIVGILIFMSRKNFMLSCIKHEKSFITSGPGVIMSHVKCISVIDGVLPSQDLPSYRTVTEPFAGMYFIDSLADCISSWSLPTFFYFPLFFFPKGKEGRHLTCYDQLQKKRLPSFSHWITLMCLSIGTPKIINFPFVPNGKFIIFRCPKI